MKLHVDGTDETDNFNLVGGGTKPPFALFDEDRQENLFLSRYRWVVRLVKWLIETFPPR